MKVKVVIDYEQTDDGKCSWNFKQEGNEELENVIRDIMEKDED